MGVERVALGGVGGTWVWGVGWLGCVWLHRGSRRPIH